MSSVSLDQQTHTVEYGALPAETRRALVPTPRYFNDLDQFGPTVGVVNTPELLETPLLRWIRESVIGEGQVMPGP